MTVATRLLRSHDYQRTRWKNDGGWTTEIASRQPVDGSDGFLWRVSIAEIERDGPFSSFPGVERDLILLAGNGIELDINDSPVVRLAQRMKRVHFAGEDVVHCRLIAGATHDFNVMARRDSIAAEVHARPLNGTMLVFIEPGETWLIHVLTGKVMARQDGQSCMGETGNTLIIEPGSDNRERIVLEGGGELVLVRFTSLDRSPAE